jgi:hypothetical protein
MMLRSSRPTGPSRLLAAALALAVLADCTGDDEPADAPAAADAADAEGADAASEDATTEPAEPVADDPAPDGVLVTGAGWSASFPGEPEQYVEEVPLPDLDITLRNDVTVWESADEALALMIAQMPVDASSPTLADEMRSQLFSTAAGMGTVLEDSPLLDADGTFRGRDAVVITDAANELNALMFVEGPTLFQVVHVSATANDGDALRSFVAGLTLDG